MVVKFFSFVVMSQMLFYLSVYHLCERISSVLDQSADANDSMVLASISLGPRQSLDSENILIVI